MVVWAPRALRHYVYSCSSIVVRASGAVRQSDMTTPSETSFRNTSKTYYELDHSAIIGMHFSLRSWPYHFKAFPNVRLAQTQMWQPNIMVWGLTWATEAVGFVNGLAWPVLAGRLLQTLISITLQSWTSSFCRHRIALSSPILIGSFHHYTSSSLSSQTLTNFMNESNTFMASSLRALKKK